MAGLKPNEEIMAASFAVATVIGVFSSQAPNLADIKASPSNNSNTHRSIKTATLTSVSIVAGIALLAKSPTTWVIGGLTIVVESWVYMHGNTLSQATKKPTMQQGQ